MTHRDASKPDVFIWSIITIWLVVTLMSFFAPGLLSANNARFINVALLTGFTVLHGARRYGVAGILIYFAIAVVVTNVLENLSVVTGFPFGQYEHMPAMGPKLLHVPLIVGPIFAVAGYLAWVLAGIILNDVCNTNRADVHPWRPLIAAFITTSWDLCVDAIGGTVNRDWVWAHGGPWFGVPWLNFFGWMLTMWVTFQLFAWVLRHRARPNRIDAQASYWMQPIVYWILIALQFPLLAVIVPDSQFIDPAGGAWQGSHLFESMALVSIFTMLFTAILALASLSQARAHKA